MPSPEAERCERRERRAGGHLGLPPRHRRRASSAQPRQRRPILLRVRRLLGMVGPRLLHRLGLGALDEARIVRGGRRGSRAPSPRPRPPWRGGPARRRCRSRLRAAGRRSPRRRRSARAPPCAGSPVLDRLDPGQALDSRRVALEPRRASRSSASRTWSGSFAPGGTLSSARAARMPLTSRISQSISGPASGSSARASGIGHFAMDQRIRPLAHRVPQFLGDERHERVEHDQDLVEHPGGDRLRSPSSHRCAA